MDSQSSPEGQLDYLYVLNEQDAPLESDNIHEITAFDSSQADFKQCNDICVIANR